MVLRKSPEFDLISRYFYRHQESEMALGVGDDAAVFVPPPDSSLVFSVDTLVAGRHFPENLPAGDIARRALGAALSDLAAMGARAHHFTLALTLPSVDDKWLGDFSEGLFEVAKTYGLILAGGDTTQGPLTITIQVHGVVPHGQAIRRSGAEVGDLVFVSGTLGDAAAGLRALMSLDERDLDHDTDFLVGRFCRPEPRLTLGEKLRSIAHAGVDISDGLLADLQHLCAASRVSVRLRVDALPISDGMLNVHSLDAAIEFALSGGDDYELLICVAPEDKALAECLGLTMIGEVLPLQEDEPLILTYNGKSFQLPMHKGYSHFE